jgi:hypothetical protein
VSKARILTGEDSRPPPLVVILVSLQTDQQAVLDVLGVVSGEAGDRLGYRAQRAKDSALLFERAAYSRA